MRRDSNLRQKGVPEDVPIKMTMTFGFWQIGPSAIFASSRNNTFQHLSISYTSTTYNTFLAISTSSTRNQYSLIILSYNSENEFLHDLGLPSFHSFILSLDDYLFLSHTNSPLFFYSLTPLSSSATQSFSSSFFIHHQMW